MATEQFNIDSFRSVLSELFDVSVSELSEEYDLSQLIKDSIDLGELVAVLASRFAVEPVDWEAFKTKTTLEEVFSNFS